MRVGSNKKEFGQPFLVSTFKIHPNYNNVTLDNDVAILSLYTPMNYSQTLKLLKLSKNIPPVGSMLKVTGFGLLNDNKSAVTLKSAKIPLVDLEKCEELYKNVTSSMLCAGYSNGPSSCMVCF